MKLLVWRMFMLDLLNLAFNAEQTIHYGTSQKRDFWSVYISQSRQPPAPGPAPAPAPARIPR